MLDINPDYCDIKLRALHVYGLLMWCTRMMMTKH